MPYQAKRNSGYNTSGQMNGNQSAPSPNEQKKHEERAAAEKAGELAGRVAADYFTGGKYEQLRNAPVVGKAAKEAEKTVGQVVGKADKLTGGTVGKTAKKLDDAGALDLVDKGLSMFGGKPGGAPGVPGGSPGSASGATNTTSSTPNSVGKTSASRGNGSGSKSKPNFLDGDNKDGSDKKQSGFSGDFLGTFPAKKAIPILLIFLFFPILFIIPLTTATNLFSSYEDGFGVSDASGGNIGGMDYTAASKDAKQFYDRVNSVKQEYQANGKSFDPLYISGVLFVLQSNGSNINYKKMNKSKIKEIADMMFDGNTFSEDLFKENLANNLFRNQLVGKTNDQYKSMANQVFAYVRDYKDLVGDNNSYTCAAVGSCIYNIKGFYIKGKGNVTKNYNISNLMVRLMQCGVGNGHNYGGTFGKPLEGEELVPFEKYILGVAYQEIGPDSPDEAIKAQLVAARSYILARPSDMGGWRKITQENGQWIIQVASCTQDQVYCDPDKGCSSPSNGQWGQIHSGLNYNGFKRSPMPQNHKLRTLAASVQGEVLVNNQDYVVYSGYTQTEQNQFIRLAKQGLNYKQILLQVYNSGSRNYNATNINKMSCNIDGTSCVAGDYTGWKQKDSKWGSIQMGTNPGSDIYHYGCLATSIAMLIARSGVPTTVNGEFNPGTFVQKLKTVGAFGPGGGLNNFAAVSAAAPNFKYVGVYDVPGDSRQQKFNKIKSLLDSGYYVVANVNNGGHWVAIDTVYNNNFTILDPGGYSDSYYLWDYYYKWSGTTRIVYFKAS